MHYKLNYSGQKGQYILPPEIDPTLVNCIVFCNGLCILPTDDFYREENRIVVKKLVSAGTVYDVVVVWCPVPTNYRKGRTV